MRKGKRLMKKSTQPIDWRQTLIGAIVDLIIGIILILISKLIE